MPSIAATSAENQTQAFHTWVKSMQLHIEGVLDQNMPTSETEPAKLHDAMRYASLSGGKRIRALLAYAAGEFCGASREKVDSAAAAAELIHAFSLVHDDMPCMDDDALRRGKASTHKKYGDATALLVGDSLQSLAFELISEDVRIRRPQKIKMLHLLAVSTGSRGMAGGQAIDIDSVGIPLTQDELETMHAYKTGALIRAATLMGAYSAYRQDEEKIKAADHFSKSIGLAFQVVDDILDAEADSETLGKTAGKDAQDNKSTYVTILGVEKAKELANELHANAMAALSFYGAEADFLRHLANYITQRNY